MKIIIWGMGNCMASFIEKPGLYKNDIIVAYVDNDEKLWGKSFRGIPILAPEELRKIEYDYVIICAFDDISIKKQMVEELKVSIEKIKTFREIETYYTRKLFDKYENDKSEEIQDFIISLKNGLSVWGNYSPDITEYEIYRDEEKHPYAMFEGKRIYYPDTHRFSKRNGKEFIGDIMYEQKDNSPHLYLKGKDDIRAENTIIDAGTCEGNFAIRFIDKVKKAYLIESDPLWSECLERTFRPYKNKTVICNKILGRYNSNETITIDTLVNDDKIDFLKMDIEGAEIDALLGAKKTLLNNNINCSICSYHKMNDEENIKFIMESLGYQTDVSEGYMFFLFDKDIFDTLDLRKGIVYAYKNDFFESVH